MYRLQHAGLLLCVPCSVSFCAAPHMCCHVAATVRVMDDGVHGTGLPGLTATASRRDVFDGASRCHDAGVGVSAGVGVIS